MRQHDVWHVSADWQPMCSHPTVCCAHILQRVTLPVAPTNIYRLTACVLLCSLILTCCCALQALRSSSGSTGRQQRLQPQSPCVPQSSASHWGGRPCSCCRRSWMPCGGRPGQRGCSRSTAAACRSSRWQRLTVRLRRSGSASCSGGLKGMHDPTKRMQNVAAPKYTLCAGHLSARVSKGWG